MSLEQFIAFTTDAVGLERTLRFVQASLMILTARPFLLDLASAFFASAGSGVVKGTWSQPSTIHVLDGIRNQVNIVRRFFRCFRFVESFYIAYQLFEALVSDSGSSSSSGSDKNSSQNGGGGGAKKPRRRAATLEPWLNVFFRAFLGMHLFLEVVILLDVVGIDGLEIWGRDTTRRISTEAMRFWFLALASDLAANLLRISRIVKDVPMPALTEEEKQDNMGSPLADGAGEENGEGEGEGGEHGQQSSEKTLASLHKERERLRRIVHGRMRQRRAWRHALRARFSMLGRRALSDALDLVLPGSAIGWIPVQPATAGVVMLTTTLLTGWEAWKRCGAQVAARKSS